MVKVSNDEVVEIEVRAGGFEKPGWSAGDMDKQPGKVILNLKS